MRHAHRRDRPRPRWRRPATCRRDTSRSRPATRSSATTAAPPSARSSRTTPGPVGAGRQRVHAGPARRLDGDRRQRRHELAGLANGLEIATRGAPRRPAVWQWVVTPLRDNDRDGHIGDELQGFIRANVSGSRMPLAFSAQASRPGSEVLPHQLAVSRGLGRPLDRRVRVVRQLQPGTTSPGSTTPIPHGMRAADRQVLGSDAAHRGDDRRAHRVFVW